jgi:hypothetical protein
VAVPRPGLLLYLDHAGRPERFATAIALAALAERAGFGFECYYDAFRAGRHFGGGDIAEARPGWDAGSTVAGGRHFDHLRGLAAAYDVVAVGDPASVLWPELEVAGAEPLAAERVQLLGAAYERLGQDVPARVVVLDGRPQGAAGVVVAPYLYPALLGGEAALAVDVSAGMEARRGLESLGAESFHGLYVDPGRASRFPGGLDGLEGEAAGRDYAAVTAELAERHAGWGEGTLLADPALAAAQLPRARRLRLLPLYGRPQTEAIVLADGVVRRSREPVFGRQYDDHDFLELSRRGHGLQVLDPDPPFDAMAGSARVPSPPRAPDEPDDEQLERWADEGRVLVTLVFWSGMVRELNGLPALIDLAAVTGLRAGLVITDQTLEHGYAAGLSLLATPPERGGTLGLLEPLAGSTGSAVAAEALMPPGTLARTLADARARLAEGLPEELMPRGWWPLLDAELVPGAAGPVVWRGRRPVVLFTPRGEPAADAECDVAARSAGASGEAASGEAASGPARPDLRSLGRSAVRALGLWTLFEERRPFDEVRPGEPSAEVVRAVREAGFSYMWTKAGFGDPRVVARHGDFVALPLTAGNWDGWSPFYTVGSRLDLLRAEARLLRARRPGWLASTIDSPLWALPGELWAQGGRLHAMAELVARGGRSGRLVNVTPNVVARYARLLDERG